ncbi:MAG: hypothetical protein JNN29_13310 [Chitinophagaceae bacterium]|nr:hypothetical protein [Chitinophagaceae bacterium]MBN8668180.1 hypothetical protein [Chitinophagales bacterium]
MSPRTNYTLYLRNEKKNLYQRMGLLLSLINFFGLLIALFPKAQEKGFQMVIIATIPVYALYWFYRAKFYKKARAWERVEYLIALLWLASPYPWMTAVFIVLQFLYQLSVGDPAVRVAQHGITYGNRFARRFAWKELSNVVLKDGLLTLDFKNNRLFQQYISEESGVIEQDFNGFCQEQLATNA